MLVRLVTYWFEQLDEWWANRHGRRAYRKWKKTCHLIPDDEFDTSLETNGAILIALSPRERQKYIAVQIARRDLAHARSLT